LWCYTNLPGTNKLRIGFYNGTESYPGSLLMENDGSHTGHCGGSYGWSNFSFQTNVSIGTGPYWVGWDEVEDQIWYKYDSGSHIYYANTESFPDPGPTNWPDGEEIVTSKLYYVTTTSTSSSTTSTTTTTYTTTTTTTTTTLCSIGLDCSSCAGWAYINATSGTLQALDADSNGKYDRICCGGVVSNYAVY
jgi:hypothetical protein